MVDLQRRLAAIVLADVVNYSGMMSADETSTLRALQKHRSELIDPLVARHFGRIVKSMGDGLLVEFSSVLEAVSCSVAVQLGMEERNQETDSQPSFKLRIGIHLGDIIVEDEDIIGEGVNIAARIETAAEPGGIALSDDAYRQVRDRTDVVWREEGEQLFKNIPRPVKIWKWDPAAAVARDVPDTVTSNPIDDVATSIAVLPFNNMSADTEQSYFADGITEDIITELSRLPNLLVISRNTTFTYKDRAVDAKSVCAELGVRSLLEGSVRKAGGKVRISAQLIDGATGAHLWAERYDRDLDDIFEVQDDVTQRIVAALEYKLTSDIHTRWTLPETRNAEAYDYMLRGREQYKLFTVEGNAKAQSYFKQAIELDQDYAAAYAGLAETYRHDWFMGNSTALEHALQFAEKAGSIDPSLPLVQEALGNVYLFLRQHDKALTAAEYWVEIEPGNADAHANLAGTYHFSGAHRRALPHIAKAMRFNPFYPFYYMLYRGQSLLALESFEEAFLAIKRATAHNPEALPAFVYLAACAGLLGRADEARQALDRVFEIYPDFTTGWINTYLPYKNAPDTERLLKGLSTAGLQES